MKKRVIIYIIIALIFGVLVSYLILKTSTRILLKDPQQECERVDGVWKTFGDTCVDLCESVRIRTTCGGEVETDGCDCGYNRCWNGKTCEDN